MARSKKTDQALSEGQLMVLLRERFNAPAWAFMPHVRNGTGWARRTTRTADALAMSLWPSRGLELHGIEIKSARADWLHEKDDPEKAEEIARFCDRWWLVIGREDIVQPGELPATWGLIVPQGKKLVTKVEAPKLEAKPLDRLQLAAILRAASECVVPRAELDEAMKLEVQRARERAESGVEARVESQTRLLKHQLDELRRRTEVFEKASGLSLGDWRLGDIAKAARFIADGGLADVRRDVARWRDQAKEIAATLDAVLSTEPAPAKTGTEDRP